MYVIFKEEGSAVILSIFHCSLRIKLLWNRRWSNCMMCFKMPWTVFLSRAWDGLETFFLVKKHFNFKVQLDRVLGGLISSPFPTKGCTRWIFKVSSNLALLWYIRSLEFVMKFKTFDKGDIVATAVFSEVIKCMCCSSLGQCWQ